MFKLNAVPFSVAPGNSGANLDVKIILQDAKGNDIRSYEITDSLNARIDTTLNAGTYYVIIDGAGNINAGNDYGSLGAYTLTGTYIGATNSTTSSTTSGTTTLMVTGVKVKEGNKINWNNVDLKGTAAISVMVATAEGDFKEIARPDPSVPPA